MPSFADSSLTAPAPTQGLRDTASLLRTAFGLALAAAVSLGLARFSYALLLPPMRADLGWSYFTAGAMNTVNALGYLIGALLMPRAMARIDARQLMLLGGAVAGGVLMLHGLTRADSVLWVLRWAAGAASAASFVGGGLLAARLAASPAGAGRSGLVLGLYYGGTGLGIVASALALPPLIASPAFGWSAAWIVLGGLAWMATALTAFTTRSLHAPPLATAVREPVQWRPLAFGLAGYLMFGLGYIGYMTFIVTLLREQGMSTGVITAFYALLGAGVVASSWLWAGLLQGHRHGRPMMILNGLLAVATALPVLSHHPVAVFISGALFGSVFLSVVASTTALVRHNLPIAQWPAGIAAFTIIFAAGQIIGPALVGWVADGAGGLWRGLAISAGVLAVGSALASQQRALPRPS